MKRLMKQLRAWLRPRRPGASYRVYGYEAAWPSLEAIAIRTAPRTAAARSAERRESR
jgi:hypothetical protein